MNSINNILKKLRESRDEQSYYVKDNSTGDKYKVVGSEAVEEKIKDLVEEGTDKDDITVSKAMNEESGEDDKAYEDFKKACMSNPTWKKANAICEKYGYRLSSVSCVDVYASGRKVPSVNIMRDRTKDYNPDIYFYAGKFGKTDPTLEIQTSSYGSLTLDQHAEFLEAVTNAHKMVEELSEIDFTTLHEYEINESKEINEEASLKIEVGTTFENAGFDWEILAIDGEYALVHAKDKRFHPYAVVWKIDPADGAWAQGHYFNTESEASRYLKSKRTDESTYLSSFDKETMRTVSDEAPSALHWKNGATVLNKKTNKEAKFLGYKKNFNGALQAVFSSEGEEFNYSLEDLQRNIKDKTLVLL